MFFSFVISPATENEKIEEKKKSGFQAKTGSIFWALVRLDAEKKRMSSHPVG
jgi:hypothetical protein